MTTPNKNESLIDSMQSLLSDFSAPVGKLQADLKHGARTLVRQYDAMDGKVDGIIHRDAIEATIMGVLPAHPTAQQAASRQQWHATLVREIPAAFRINQAHLDHAIDHIVGQADSNHDGRVSGMELMNHRSQASDAKALLLDVIVPVTPPTSHTPTRTR